MATVIDCIYEVGGIVHVRMKKSDGGWHRATIEPGVDPDAMMAEVNRHLESMGVDRVGAQEIIAVKREAARIHTPEVVAAARARREQI